MDGAMTYYRILRVAMASIFVIGLAGSGRMCLALGDPSDPTEPGKGYREQTLEEAIKLFESGRIDEAIASGRKVVAIDRALLKEAEEGANRDAGRVAEERKRLAISISWVAAFHFKRGDLPAAKDFLEESVALKAQALGELHLDHLQALSALGSLNRKMGRYQEAEACYRRSLKLREDAFGMDHPEVAQGLNDLANLYVYDRTDRYAEAEPLIRRALKIQEEKLGLEALDVATTLESLGDLYEAMDRLDDAEAVLRRGIAIREAKLGADHSAVADLLYKLADIERDKGRSGPAVALLQRCLTIYEADRDRNALQVARTQNKLAMCYMDIGQELEAIPLLQSSLKILEDRLGPDHAELAPVLNNMAVLIMTAGGFFEGINGGRETWPAKAEEFFQRSLKIHEAHGGADSVDAARVLVNLGAIAVEKGEHDRAEALYTRALKIIETRLGPDDPQVGVCLDRLGDLYVSMKRIDRAEPLYRRCLKIREARLGPDHPDLASILETLAQLSAAQGHWDEVAKGYDRIRRIQRRFIGLSLPGLPYIQQLTFLEINDEKSFHQALSLGLRNRDDTRLVALSAGWVVNGKGIAQEALAEGALLTRSGDARTAEVARQLLSVRSRLATLAQMLPEDRDAVKALDQQVARLAEEERVLAARLGQATRDRQADDPWVELSAVRAAIPPDAVLIEFADFDAWDFEKGRWEPAARGRHYAAWVIPPSGRGDVRLVDLGDGWKIAQAIEAFHQSIAGTNAAVFERGEAEVEAEARKLLKAIADRILAPLEPHIGGFDRWLISADNELWLVPWTALPLAGGRYAIEGHRINLLVSGRDLVRARYKAADGPALVMADADFDLAPAAGGAEARRLISRDGRAERGPEAPANDSISRGWAPLPGTAEEAKAAGPLLALEGVFKAAERPRIVLLSTHGFITRPQPMPAPTARADEDLQIIPPARKERMIVRGLNPSWESLLKDPLVRCGLILAGANKRGEAGGEAIDDGILTGLEIVGTDLRGTELVVLSACETGLGDNHQGEGIAGLRQAFQLAGADAVVATLWRIPDDASAELMTAFWVNLAAGRTASDALRDAQLAVIKSRRASVEQAAHPYYWAAFTFTGRP
jgi:CHAT domain-containing protein